MPPPLVCGSATWIPTLTHSDVQHAACSPPDDSMSKNESSKIVKEMMQQRCAAERETEKIGAKGNEKVNYLEIVETKDIGKTV